MNAKNKRPNFSSFGRYQSSSPNADGIAIHWMTLTNGWHCLLRNRASLVIGLLSLCLVFGGVGISAAQSIDYKDQGMVAQFSKECQVKYREYYDRSYNKAFAVRINDKGIVVDCNYYVFQNHYGGMSLHIDSALAGCTGARGRSPDKCEIFAVNDSVVIDSKLLASSNVQSETIARPIDAKSNVDEERIRREVQVRLEEERKQREVQAKVEEERIRREVQANLEEERKKRESQVRTDEERRQREIQARAEEDRARRESQAIAEEVRKQRELEAKADDQRRQSVASSRTTRKALIIGNDSYTSVPRLRSARTDASAIEQAFLSAGYSVFAHYDVNEREMKRVIREFARRIEGGDEVFFFFAGHGVQLGGANYLLPTDIRAEDATAVRDEGISLQRVMDDLAESKARLTLAVIDACRDNPFTSAGRMIGGRGLAATNVASGQMIVFSAGAGQQALDHVGPNDRSPNGLFTRVFLKHIRQKGATIDRIMRQVRAEVMQVAKSIGHDQVPALYDQVVGDFYFVP